MEVAVNLLRAVILNLNTRGHCRAVWRSRGDLRGQQGRSLGRSDLGSEARRPQGRHGRKDGGCAAAAAAADAGGVCECV